MLLHSRAVTILFISTSIVKRPILNNPGKSAISDFPSTLQATEDPPLIDTAASKPIFSHTANICRRPAPRIPKFLNNRVSFVTLDEEVTFPKIFTPDLPFPVSSSTSPDGSYSSSNKQQEVEDLAEVLSPSKIVASRVLFESAERMDISEIESRLIRFARLKEQYRKDVSALPIVQKHLNRKLLLYNENKPDNSPKVDVYGDMSLERLIDVEREIEGRIKSYEKTEPSMRREIEKINHVLQNK